MTRRGSWIRRSTRLAIYFRDGFRCIWCRSTDQLSLDHLEPGDNHDPKNLVTACTRCNSSRQNRTLGAWYAKLRERGERGVRFRVWNARRRALNPALGLFAERTGLPVSRLAHLWARVPF